MPVKASRKPYALVTCPSPSTYIAAITWFCHRCAESLLAWSA